MNLMAIPGWLKTIEQVAPVILQFTPLSPLVPFVVAGISAAESIPGATGAQKLAAATQIVNVGVAAANAQAGKQIIDPTSVNEAVSSGISAVVNTANLIKNPDGK